MYEMLRHSVPGALNIIIKETRYCKDNSRDKVLHSTTVLANYIFDDYCTCGVLVKIYKNILGSLIRHIYF